ncbi:MAG: acetyltransferase [Nitrospinales bacterium]
MKEKIILIGGGGHCKACIDVIEQEGSYQIAGIVDLAEMLDQQVLGYEIFATDKDLPALVKQNFYFLNTIGQIESPKRRIDIYEQLESNSAKIASVVSPTAYVSRHARIGVGTIVMHDAVVNAGAKIGKNCIINSKALVEHDAFIEDHCHISTGAIINGGVQVGSGTFVGSNAVCREYIKVGAHSVIGCGARIVKNVSADTKIQR